MLGHRIGQLMATRAVQHQGAQTGAKARGFAVPVAHQAHRGDHQRGGREAACVFFDLDVGQGLQRFSQAHVVGQDAAQALGAQKLQPVQPLLLVRAQAGMHTGRQGHLGDGAGALELLHQGLQRRRTLPHRALAQGGTGSQGFQPRQAQAGLRKIDPALAHQLQQGSQPGAQRLGGQAHKAALGIATRHVDKRRQLRLPGGGVGRVLRGLGDQVGQPGQHVVALAVQFHAQ